MNFKIVRKNGAFHIMPLTPIGESLCRHYHFHGDKLTYSKLSEAVTRMSDMEFELQNRKGQQWLRIKKEG